MNWRELKWVINYCSQSRSHFATDFMGILLTIKAASILSSSLQYPTITPNQLLSLSLMISGYLSTPISNTSLQAGSLSIPPGQIPKKLIFCICVDICVRTSHGPLIHFWISSGYKEMSCGPSKNTRRRSLSKGTLRHEFPPLGNENSCTQ